MAPRCNISPVYAVVITRSCSFFFPFHYRFPFSVYYFSLLLLPPALLFFGADFCRSRFAVIPVYTRPVNMFNHGPSFIYSFSTWDLVSTNFLVTVASVVLVSHHSIHMLTFFVCTLLFLLTWPLVFFDALVSLLLLQFSPGDSIPVDSMMNALILSVGDQPTGTKRATFIIIICVPASPRPHTCLVHNLVYISHSCSYSSSP